MPLLKPPQKESDKAKAKREAGIAQVLEAAGAQAKNKSWREEWVLKTTVGDLVIIPFEDWIACQFDDPKAASEVLGGNWAGRLNTANGKWNWHLSYPKRTEAEHIQIVIDELRRYQLI